ncbi:MAG: glycosyltransferase family 39 protein [Candidatus Sumerlaeia bacterium]
MKPHTDKRPVALLAAVWAGLLPFYAAWLALDRVVAPWDMAVHTGLAHEFWDNLLKLHVLGFYRLSMYYPPLFHVVAAPLTVFGGNPDVYCAANWVFLLLTMAAVWLIGVELWGDFRALVAAVLVPACVNIAWMCIQPMTDLSLTAMVAWTVWALLRTPRLEDGRQAHVLGILVGLGMLAKWTCPFFTLVPIAIYLVENFRASRKPAFYRRVLIVAAWAALIAGPWYVRALPEFVRKLGPQLGGAVAAAEGDPAVMSIDSWTRYAVDLFRLYLRWPLTIFAAAGVAVPVAQKRFGFIRDRNMLIVIAAAASGWLFMTLVANKDPRYIMPAVPLIVVAAAGWLSILGKHARLCVAAAVLATFAMTGWNLFVFHGPARGDTCVESVADWLAAQRAGRKGRVKAVVVPNQWTLNAAALQYTLRLRDPDGEAKGVSRFRDGNIPADRFVITLNPPGPNTGVSPREQEITATIDARPEWVVVKTFTRFDGKKIEIRRNGPPVTAPR